jgi:hypothetical protein
MKMIVGDLTTYQAEFPSLPGAMKDKTETQRVGTEVAIRRARSKARATTRGIGLQVCEPPLHACIAAARVGDQERCAVVIYMD